MGSPAPRPAEATPSGPADAQPSGPAGVSPLEAAATPLAGDSAAARVLRALAARHQTLAVAESLTGGLLAATIVDVPGASAVFRGGLVVYATDLKASLGGVPAHLLALRGPVDADVAAALAAGARQRCAADWGLATTGVAGPDPQDGQPVGTVFVAAQAPVGGAAGARVRRLTLAGDRAAVRTAAVAAALDLLLSVLTT
jgi:nicotinamide-nucleotide amidase